MEHSCEKRGDIRSSLHCWRPCLGVRKCQSAILPSFCPDHLQELQSCWDFQRGTHPCAPLSQPPSISSQDPRTPWQAGCQPQVTMCFWQRCEELSGSIWAPDPSSAEQFSPSAGRFSSLLEWAFIVLRQQQIGMEEPQLETLQFALLLAHPSVTVSDTALQQTCSLITAC